MVYYVVLTYKCISCLLSTFSIIPCAGLWPTNIYIHCVPLFMSLVNFLFLANVTIKFEDVWIIMLLILVYYTYSICLKIFEGIVLYPYLNWELDAYSMVYELSVPIIMPILHLCLSLLSQLLRGRYQWDQEWLNDLFIF